MVDGLGIQLLSLTPYTQHYDWGTWVLFITVLELEIGKIHFLQGVLLCLAEKKMTKCLEVLKMRQASE